MKILIIFLATLLSNPDFQVREGATSALIYISSNSDQPTWYWLELREIRDNNHDPERDWRLTYILNEVQSEGSQWKLWQWFWRYPAP